MSRSAPGLADLMGELRQGGEKVGEGRFRIDSSRAIAKLRDFRLADPHHYALELLRAAVVSGAERADVRIDADELELRFDGAPFPEAALRELFGFALSGSADRDTLRLRLLAFGLLGALALEPKELTVQAGRIALRFGRNAQIEVEESKGGASGTRVYLRKRAGLRVMRNLLAGAPEIGLLQSRTRLLPLRLRINGEEPPPPPEAAAPVAQRESEEEGRRVVATALPAREGATALHLCVHGVEVACHEIARTPLAAEVWVDDDALRRNASGSDVVRDEAHRAVVRRVVTLIDDMLSDVVARLGGREADELRPLLVARVAALAEEKIGEGFTPRARQILFEAPLLPGPSGEWVAIAELRRDLRRGGAVRIAYERYPSELYKPPVVLLPLGPHEDALLPKGRRRDVAVEVRARLQRDRNRAVWAAQRVEEPRLGAGDFACRGPLAGEGIRGEVGLVSRPLHGPEPEVRFLLEGRPLVQRGVERLRPLPLAAVVDGAFTPDESWEGLTEDAAFEGAVEAIGAAAERSLIEALNTANVASFDALRLPARALLVWLSGRERLLPPVLKAAPLYPLAGGGFTSLEEIERRGRCRTVYQDWPHAALDGEPVVAVEAVERELLRRLLGNGRITDMTGQLSRELDVRRRLAGPRETPRLSPAPAICVAVTGEGIEGELGLGWDALTPPQIELTLLRDGFRLATERLPARYGGGAAVVESAALAASPTWDGALHDDAWKRVVEAVAAAEARLPGAVATASRQPLTRRSPAERVCLEAYMRERWADGAEPPAEGDVVATAPLFASTSRLVSLNEIQEAARRRGRVFAAGEEERLPRVPEELLVVTGDPAAMRLLEAVCRQPIEHPGDEIEKMHARSAFDRLPERPLKAPAGLRFRTPVESPPFAGEIAARPGLDPGARIDVLYRRRLLCIVERDTALPLAGVVDVDHASVDPADAALPRALAKALAAQVGEAERRLVEAALREPEAAGAADLLLDAVADGLAEQVNGLRRCPLFPTVTGGRASLSELQGRKRVRYVTEELRAPQGDELTVVALDPRVERALKRLGKRRRNVTEQLRERSAAFAAHQRRPEIPVRVPDPVWHRRALEGDDLEGDVAIVPGDGGDLFVFHERRLLCVEKFPGPFHTSAAVASSRLETRRDLEGVKRDRGFTAVVERAIAELERLIPEAVAEWRGRDERERSRLAPALAPAVAWLLDRLPREDPVFDAELLVATCGRLLSFRSLLDEQSGRGRVRVSARSGELMARGGWVWRPRPGERESLPARVLRLQDATAALERADEIRAQPPVARLSVPGGRWAEPVRGPGLEGEAALPPAPTRELVAELHVGRRLVERLSSRHAFGGTARVDGASLRPDESWSRIVRDAAFQAARQAIDDALERALARLVREGTPADQMPFLDVLIARPALSDGAGGYLIDAIPAFASVAGGVVRIGEVRAAASGGGRVGILDPEWVRRARERTPGLLERLAGQAGNLLLLAGPEDVERLSRLAIRVDDRTPQLRGEVERAERLEQQKLTSHRYEQPALARLAVDEHGWRGELALPPLFDAGSSIRLAREGVLVDRHHVRGLGVAGVLEHPELPVDANWIEARLDAAARSFVDDKVEELLLALSRGADRLDPGGRVGAARYALAVAARQGVRDPRQLDRLSGASAALADAPVFPAADGRWLSLRAVADHVLRGGRAVILPDALAPGEGGEALILRAAADAAWLEPLVELLGRGAVERLGGAEEWRRARAEREPGPDDPLAAGLALLRREAALLRAGATGRLSEKELSEIRFSRDGGGDPIRYDPERALALVDPDSAPVRQALEAAASRPEPLYILIAAIYGAVNRALERVTDDDEERLMGSLLRQLAANPELLGGR